MTSDKFDDERLLARKTNENKMKNGFKNTHLQYLGLSIDR